MAIDWNFIKELEGFSNKGYIPSEDDGTVIGKSGVTIGSGVDLGQMTEKQIQALNISEELKKKLLPYANKTKDKAKDFLSQNPLVLSEDEAMEVTEAIKKRERDSIRKWYNKNTKSGKDFSELTDREQTVIASVGFQYGSNFKATPKFADYVLNDKWDKVVDELRNFGDDFESRRHKELQYLVGAKPDGVIGEQTIEEMAQFKLMKDSKGLFAASMAAREPQRSVAQRAPESDTEQVSDQMQKLIEMGSMAMTRRNSKPQVSETRRRGEEMLAQEAAEAEKILEARRAEQEEQGPQDLNQLIEMGAKIGVTYRPNDAKEVRDEKGMTYADFIQQVY